MKGVITPTTSEGLSESSQKSEIESATVIVNLSRVIFTH